jgi:hypothetical protein
MNEGWTERDTFDAARLTAEEDFRTGREPTARELDAMNAQSSETAFERDEERYGPMGTGVVQVRIAGATARTYAYEVPRGMDVAPGGWVRLPGNVVSEDGGFGLVKSYGRVGYDGPLKSITAVIDEPDPLMVQMSVVKTKEQAAKIYDKALAASGWTIGDLEELIKVGTARLASRGVL